MGGIDDERGEHRVDPLAEQPLQIRLLARGQLLPPQHLDAVLAQHGLDRAGIVLGVAEAELAGQAQGAGQDLLGRPPGHALHRQAGRHPAHPARDPDHEELIQVAREDRQEPDPLQQRERLVLGELEHPLVEPQPAFLAVEVAAGRKIGPLLVAALGRAGRPHRGHVLLGSHGFPAFLQLRRHQAGEARLLTR